MANSERRYSNEKGVNKKKICGLVGIITGCIVSVKMESPAGDIMGHMFTCIGAYTMGRENMKDTYRTARTYTRAGLARIGIHYNK